MKTEDSVEKFHPRSPFSFCDPGSHSAIRKEFSKGTASFRSVYVLKKIALFHLSKIPCKWKALKVLRQPWNGLTLQLLLSVRDNLTNKIVLSLLVYSPEARVINLFAILRVFLMVLGN